MAITVAAVERESLFKIPGLADLSSRVSSYWKLGIPPLVVVTIRTRPCILITPVTICRSRSLSANRPGGEAGFGHGADSAAIKREEESEGL